ncbi:hypothetical protein BBJ29_009773 [Phytophthora kernoviae]|uniref:RUN domain-containing protein n=1 Tax=Phytophthora kernoviae TaxID=325452 RepID=A0A421G8Z6_9STRA|nr:hypothetical protein BBJ29_009773 [Phytophthora kernoviae]
MVLSETNLDLLASYYTEFALFRQRDEVKMFLNILSGLGDLPFAFLIDDPRLDLAPETLPISHPLPRPKARKIKKQAPKLIDPEDIVRGRVRLSQADSETDLLAKKLASHHELRLASNTRKGGNPLSETLRQAAQPQKMEDAATAVLRFLELGYPEYDVFGSDLLDVLCKQFIEEFLSKSGQIGCIAIRRQSHHVRLENGDVSNVTGAKNDDAARHQFNVFREEISAGFAGLRFY